MFYPNRAILPHMIARGCNNTSPRHIMHKSPLKYLTRYRGTAQNSQLHSFTASQLHSFTASQLRAHYARIKTRPKIQSSHSMPYAQNGSSVFVRFFMFRKKRERIVIRTRYRRSLSDIATEKKKQTGRQLKGLSRPWRNIPHCLKIKLSCMFAVREKRGMVWKGEKKRGFSPPSKNKKYRRFLCLSIRYAKTY